MERKALNIFTCRNKVKHFTLLEKTKKTFSLLVEAISDIFSLAETSQKIFSCMS